MMDQTRTPAILLDGRFFSDRARAHEILKDALALPSYYGANLDALFDCLSTCADTHIYVYFASALRRSLGEYGDDLISTLLDAAGENDALRVTVCE